MNELTLPIHNLLGQPVRAALTTLGVAVAVAGFIALTGLTQGLQHAFDRGIGESGADLIVDQRDAFSLINSSVPESLGAVIAKVGGVETVSGTLLTIANADNDANIVITGWPAKSFLWQNLKLVEGRIPNETGELEVVLGETIANALKKKVGDSVELQFQPFKIVGVASFGTTLNQNLAIMLLPGLQKLLGRAGAVTLYQIQLKRPLDPQHIADVRAQLAATGAGYAVNNTADFASNIRFFHIIQAFAATISVIVLGMALLAIANTLLMAVSERTYELGILGAIGWSPLRILRLIMIESMLMTAIGGVAGVGLGIGVMNLVANTHIAAGVVEPYLTAGMVAQALISVLLIGPLGALYPAWRAIRLKPAEALRAR
jgi:putative ABC transport system permease protein